MSPKYQGSTLTDERRQAIITSLRNGAYFTQACRAAGVPVETGKDWLKKAKTDAPNGLYWTFADDCEVASAQHEVAAVALMMTAAQTDWRAALEVLKRRAPERWGDSQRIEFAAKTLALDEVVRMVLKSVGDALAEPDLVARHFRDGAAAAAFYEVILARLDQLTRPTGDGSPST